MIVTIVATGLMVSEAVKAREILAAEGIDAGIINIHTIKPIDKDILVKAAKETGLIVTVEEHNIACPTCGKQMTGTRWFAQPGRRYMDLATCPEHGKFLIRVRLSQQPLQPRQTSGLHGGYTPTDPQALLHSHGSMCS